MGQNITIESMMNLNYLAFNYKSIYPTQIESYSGFENAFFTLLRIILGDFDFDEIRNAHRVIGPAFFISYVFFVFFVIIVSFLQSFSYY